jgi:hypothetical protein
LPAGGPTHLTFIGTAAFDGHAGEVRYEQLDRTWPFMAISTATGPPISVSWPSRSARWSRPISFFEGLLS